MKQTIGCIVRSILKKEEKMMFRIKPAILKIAAAAWLLGATGAMADTTLEFTQWWVLLVEDHATLAGRIAQGNHG